MRTTFVTPFTAGPLKDPQRRPTATAPLDANVKPARTDVLLVGFDFGTNTSCLKACNPGSTDLLVNETIPTVVGYASEGIVENLLPGNARVLYGQAALKNRLYLRLVPPLADGVVDDLAAAQDFAAHLKQVVNAPAGSEVRAVVGLPANSDRTAQENLCLAVQGLFDRIILIPEPFLAALGYRDETKLSDPAYIDPVRNSLIVDIGAGTSDLCLVQGYYPTPEDQMCLAFAGDKVDMLLDEAIRKAYPDVQLSLVKVREIKEQYSYVGKLDGPVNVNVVIGGKMRKLDLGEPIGRACDQLLQRVVEGVKTMIGRVSADSVAEMMQNILITGGGSRIRNFDSEVQRLLVEDGYEKPRVTAVGEHYKEYVARGALVAARQARENQWQRLTRA